MATASSIEIRRAEAQEQAAGELAEIRAALKRIEAALGTGKTSKADDAEPKADTRKGNK